MDFDDTPAEAAFRAECRDFLAAHGPLRTGATHHVVGVSDHEGDLAHAAECRAWQRTKFDAGWAGLTWPAAFGGRGLDSARNAIFVEEEGRYQLPIGVFSQAVGMAGPTLIAHGNDEQRRRFLEPILRGDQIWCQLFSEPGAGSDLAGLRMRADRDGDELVVSGQKVWTTFAHFADWGMLLVRTNPDVPKHRGITYLVVDMRSAGIEVRPLRQATGGAEFNEVFFDEVRVPLANVVGAVDDGWRVAMTTLTSERADMGSSKMVTFEEVLTLARATGVTGDPLVRQRLAHLHTGYEINRFLGYRARTALSRGRVPGPEVSIAKLASGLRLAEQADLALAVQGAAGMLAGRDAIADGFFQATVFMGQWMARIGGGTEQVQRTILADRMLGLPSEPRADRELPFRDVPH